MFIKSVDWDGLPRILINTITGIPVKINAKFKGNQGDIIKVTGGTAPHKPSSTGFIWCETLDGKWKRNYYPGCFDLEWRVTCPSAIIPQT